MGGILQYSRDEDLKAQTTGILQQVIGNHSVRFYSDDQYLAESVSTFLAQNLARGRAGLVITRQSHREQIAHELQAKGFDLAEARAIGRYVEIDAEAFLAAVMVNGRPDPSLFHSIAGDVIERACASCVGGSRRAAVYGEAVDFLCARGGFEAAKFLEQLWNDLLRKQPFSLLCGYAVGRFERAAHDMMLQDVCAQHSEVFPEEGYLQLKSEPDRRRYVVRLQHKAHALQTEIRERQRTEEALARSEKLAALGRLAASIAHEINNPLTSLTNLLYLLQTQGSLEPTARHYATLADQELRRIARITKQMLGFYRDTTSPVPCKLADIIDGVLDLYEPQIAKNNIRLEKQYDFERTIEGFPAEMRQLFANLIGNAIQAAGKHGRIRVRVSEQRNWTQPRQRGARISIADNGPGISPEDRPMIFNPFFTTKGEAGTGLGLWVSQGIVHKHKGRIRFRSRVGPGERQGTIFSIFLPAARSKRVGVAPQPAMRQAG